MTSRALPTTVIAILIAASCGSGDDAVPADTDPPPVAPTTTVGQDEPVEPSAPAEPVAMAARQPSTAPTDTAGSAVTAFGLDLLAQAIGSDDSGGNVVISPLSIAIALGMLEPGTTGAAQSELRELLRIDDPVAWHASMNALEQDLESRTAELPFADDSGEQDPGEFLARIANAAFLQPGYPFHQEYLDTVGTNYGAVLEELDFASDQVAAADRIDGFISDATDGRISDLIRPEDIDPATVLALVNALLLQASWQNEFDPDATTDEPFTRLDGSEAEVPLMRARGDRSGGGDGWVAATKQLVGGIELEVVLPDEGRFEEVAARYAEVVAEYDGATNPAGALAIPRFETRVTTPLNDILIDLGLVAPFRQGNLMGIADDPRLVVDKVLHQAWLSVDEGGIEAAAATIVLVIPTSAPADPPIDVVLDRPFLFRIVDQASGATLFTGQILDPTA